MGISHSKPPKGASQLHHHHFYMPQLGRHRNIRILLPPDYFTATERRFPVIYMQDGQNLFEAHTAFAGNHWKIPTTKEKLPKKYQAIIVGIDNGGIDRMHEYAPFKRGDHGGQGDAYVRFLVETLKPFVDTTYRTLPQRDTTGIAGSSMGGLISMFAGLKYAHVFGKVGVLSPSVWFNPGILELAAKHTGAKSQFYVLGSKIESKTMEKHLQEIYWAFKKGGFNEEQVRVIIRERGKHNEAFWAKEFGKMMRYFFS